MVLELAESNESIDSILSKLMVDHPSPNTIEIDNKKANIGISEETFDKLNSMKLYSTETYNSVIFRLISEKGK